MQYSSFSEMHNNPCYTYHGIQILG